MRTVSKSATFLATESMNSAPFKTNKRGETKVQSFGKESAKLIANFSATMVTSLPSLSIAHRAHLTHNIGSAEALPILCVRCAW